MSARVEEVARATDHCPAARRRVADVHVAEADLRKCASVAARSESKPARSARAAIPERQDEVAKKVAAYLDHVERCTDCAPRAEVPA